MFWVLIFLSLVAVVATTAGEFLCLKGADDVDYPYADEAEFYVFYAIPWIILLFQIGSLKSAFTNPWTWREVACLHSFSAFLSFIHLGLIYVAFDLYFEQLNDFLNSDIDLGFCLWFSGSILHFIFFVSTIVLSSFGSKKKT